MTMITIILFEYNIIIHERAEADGDGPVYADAGDSEDGEEGENEGGELESFREYLKQSTSAAADKPKQ